MTKRSDPWLPDLIETLERLGGIAPLARIYETVYFIRLEKGCTPPPNFASTVRQALLENCDGTKSYRGSRDIFYMPEGKGRGIWGLRSMQKPKAKYNLRHGGLLANLSDEAFAKMDAEVNAEIATEIAWCNYRYGPDWAQKFNLNERQRMRTAPAWYARKKMRRLAV